MHKCILTFLLIESGSMATRGHLSSEDGCLTLRLLEFSTGLLIRTDYKVTSRVWACSLYSLKIIGGRQLFVYATLGAFLAESASSFCLVSLWYSSADYLTVRGAHLLCAGWGVAQSHMTAPPGTRLCSSQVSSSGSLSAALGPYLARSVFLDIFL